MSSLNASEAAAPARFRFDRAPLRVYWEVTRACDLACRHCRAEAGAGRHPAELAVPEAANLAAQLASAGPPHPHLILTGGDPFKRADLFDLIAAARAAGLRVSVSPSATPLLTPDVIHRLHASGVDAISLSLDGSTAPRHDAVRGVPGTFTRTLDAARTAVAAGLSVQVNTLAAASTLDDLPAVYERVVELGAERWSLFFLVQVGRGRVLDQISPQACETLMIWLTTLPRGVPRVTTTEAPHFRRVLLERTGRRGGHGAGVRDGNGIMFISHTGDVFPSGFLPLAAGNVRDAHPLTIYRESELFRRLREPEHFQGRCGACTLAVECGGSRARAFQVGGDPFGEDPLCLRPLG